MRYKIILSLFFIGILCPVFAQIQFVESDLDKAMAQAKAENKLLFVDFYATWCGPCKRMAQDVFTLPEVGEYFNKHFISCKLDAEKEVDKSVLKKYDVTGFPCMVFMNAEGKSLRKVLGMVAPGILLSEARVVTGDELPFEKQYSLYQKDKKKTELAAELLLKARYFLSGCSDYDREKWGIRIEALFNDYVKNKGLKNMVNAEDFFLITQYHPVLEKNDPVFSFVVDHYDDFLKVADHDLVSSYIIGLNNSKIIRLCKAGNLDYKKELMHLDGKLKGVYADVKFGNVSVKEAVGYLADATYCLYRNNEKGFFENQDRYFAALGDSLTVTDYTQPLLDLYTVYQGNLSENARHKVIEWCGKALEKQMEPEMRTRLLVIMGECYRGIGENAKAKQALNQAFLTCGQITNAGIQAQMQATIQQELEGL